MRALGAACIVLVASCGPTTAAERGEELFHDPDLSGSRANPVSCATCHATGDAATRILPGGSLRGVLGRPTYWGGTLTDPRAAVNTCLYYFMLAPSREALTADDARGRDLLTYLETLGTDAAAPIAFTVPITLTLELPPGDAARGESLYRSACGDCHGAIHSGAGAIDGSLAPAIPDETIGEHGTYARERVVAKVRWGGFHGLGGAMPPFSLEVLDDVALADLLAYLGV